MAPFVIGNILNNDFMDIWENKLEYYWNNPKVTDYISNFDEEDRNNLIINYYDEDIYIS